VLGAGVDGGGRHAEQGAGQAAEQRQEQGLGEELPGDVQPGGAQRPAQADLGAAFQDGDDHNVGDANAVGEQGECLVGSSGTARTYDRAATVPMYSLPVMGKRLVASSVRAASSSRVSYASCRVGSPAIALPAWAAAWRRSPSSSAMRARASSPSASGRASPTPSDIVHLSPDIPPEMRP
jgi:hypothetical protein